MCHSQQFVQSMLTVCLSFSIIPFNGHGDSPLLPSPCHQRFCFFLFQRQTNLCPYRCLDQISTFFFPRLCCRRMTNQNKARRKNPMGLPEPVGDCGGTNWWLLIVSSVDCAVLRYEAHYSEQADSSIHFPCRPRGFLFPLVFVLDCGLNFIRRFMPFLPK